MTQAVIVLYCAPLADDLDTSGYHFLTSVSKTLIGNRHKTSHMFLASVLHLRSQLWWKQKLLVQ